MVRAATTPIVSRKTTYAFDADTGEAFPITREQEVSVTPTGLFGGLLAVSVSAFALGLGMQPRKVEVPVYATNAAYQSLVDIYGANSPEAKAYAAQYGTRYVVRTEERTRLGVVERPRNQGLLNFGNGPVAQGVGAVGEGFWIVGSPLTYIAAKLAGK